MSKLLNLIKEIKNEYISRFCTISYEYTKLESCIARWIRELNNDNYNKIFENITMRQKGNLVIFKYMKFEALFTRLDGISYSDFWDIYDGLYRECRGIVIDVKEDCIASRPFDKFFGINERKETLEKRIYNLLDNAKCVQFTDKLDGSIIAARIYKDNLVVSSSGMLEGSQIIDNAEDIITKGAYINLLNDYKGYTAMFESISPNDTHIVIYAPNMYGLHLIGMRNVNTGALLPYSEIIKIAGKYGIKTTEYYDMDFHQILESRCNYKAQDKEGYVMYIDGMLIKIKCDDYILMHKMWSSKCSMNNLIEAIHKDVVDDILQGVTGNQRATLDNGIAFISEYQSLMDKKVKEYLKEAPEDNVVFFKWVNTVPKYIRRYVVNEYLGRPLSYLVIRDDGKQVQYVRYSEIENIVKILKADE